MANIDLNVVAHLLDIIAFLDLHQHRGNDLVRIEGIILIHSPFL